MKEQGSALIAVLLGIAMGFAAHFGVIIHDRGWPSVREVVGYLMIQGAIATLALTVVRIVKIDSPELAALVGVSFSLGAREAIQYLKRRSKTEIEKALP